ncbi:MAG: TolC family protein [Acidobacteria bacterium]|nr:TolC family protein [Acidobacteriota bacterium]MYG74141.1 TolC family protein [Acidobacteriota bacterium]
MAVLMTVPVAAGIQPEPPPAFYAPEPELRNCLDNAIERHPALLASRANYQATRERVPQVTALPDPTLNVSQALRRVETRVGSQTGGITLTQSLPWFGTRDLRGRVALSEADAQFLRLQAEEREVISRAKRAFYDIAYLDTALRLLEEERSLLGHYETLARARYATGQGLQQAVIRLQAELTRIDDRQRQLTGQRRTLAANLNTLCARSPETAVPPIRPMEPPAVSLDRAQLMDLGERNRQELRAATALIEASEDAVELAGMNFRPRFTASLALMNVAGRDPADALGPLPPDEGKNSLSLSLGVSLPVWKDKYRAGVEEAGHRLTANRRRLEEAQDAMENTVELALIRIETIGGQLALLETVLIPQSEETLRATETAYETGQVGVLDLLDGERVQLDVLRMRARYVSDFLIALADLERGIGTRVPLPAGGSS